MDNTLLDNDRIQADIRATSSASSGPPAEIATGRSWRSSSGARLPRLPRRRSSATGRASARAAPADARRRSCSTTLSPTGSTRRARRARSASRPGADGDPHRRRRGVPAAQARALRPRSRRWTATCSIYIHKEQELDDVERRYPAGHYVLVDDKPRILAAVKKVWGARVTTVLPATGQFRQRPEAARRRIRPPTSPRSHRRPARLPSARPDRRSEVTTMKATQQAARSRPEPLARQHHPRPADSGTLEALHRRALGHRADLEPDHLRPRHQEQQRLRRARSARSSRQGTSGEALFFELALEDLDPGRRPVPADPRPDRRRGRLGVARGVAAAGLRHRRARSRRPGSCTRAPSGRTCSSRSPARTRACPPSRRRSSPACPST